jgi:hypothetical protein
VHFGADSRAISLAVGCGTTTAVGGERFGSTLQPLTTSEIKMHPVKLALEGREPNAGTNSFQSPCFFGRRRASNS